VGSTLDGLLALLVYGYSLRPGRGCGEEAAEYGGIIAFDVGLYRGLEGFFQYNNVGLVIRRLCYNVQFFPLWNVKINPITTRVFHDS